MVNYAEREFSCDSIEKLEIHETAQKMVNDTKQQKEEIK
jgi:hypothetical protein